MKKRLYLVEAEYVWGDSDENKEKREKQFHMLAEMGLEDTRAKGIGGIICDAEQALELLERGFCGGYVSPDKFKPFHSVAAGPSIEEFLEQVATKFAEQAAKPLQPNLNERCGTQEQPGAGLFAVTETLLMENACTDALQSRLSDGWRIIAVQPQPDQRRPDYILGRTFGGGLPQSAQRG